MTPGSQGGGGGVGGGGNKKTTKVRPCVYIFCTGCSSGSIDLAQVDGRTLGMFICVTSTW